MGIQHEAFGDNPRWEECEPTGKAEPVRDETTPENVAVVRIHYRNTLDDTVLQLTATEPLTEPGEGPKQEAENRLGEFVDQLRLTFGSASIEFPDDEQSPTDGEPLGADEAVVASEDTTHLALELLDEPHVGGPPDVLVNVDPRIGKGKAHVYTIVARTTRASARVRATRGKVRMGIMRNEAFVSPLTTNEAGGGPSPTVSASSYTPTTFKLRVRGLGDNNSYRISTCWKRVS